MLLIAGATPDDVVEVGSVIALVVPFYPARVEAGMIGAVEDAGGVMLWVEAEPAEGVKGGTGCGTTGVVEGAVVPFIWAWSAARD